jgi:hypothetical protein
MPYCTTDDSVPVSFFGHFIFVCQPEYDNRQDVRSLNCATLNYHLDIQPCKDTGVLISRTARDWFQFYVYTQKTGSSSASFPAWDPTSDCCGNLFLHYRYSHRGDLRDNYRPRLTNLGIMAFLHQLLGCGSNCIKIEWDNAKGHRTFQAPQVISKEKVPSKNFRGPHIKKEESTSCRWDRWESMPTTAKQATKIDPPQRRRTVTRSRSERSIVLDHVLDEIERLDKALVELWSSSDSLPAQT